MSSMTQLRSAYVAIAHVGIACILVFSLFGGLLGWLLEPEGDRWCLYLQAERVPVVETVDEDICIFAL